MNVNNYLNMVEIWEHTKTFFRNYKIRGVFISPLINVLFSAIGNTAGIWIGYLIINYIFSGVWKDLTWPGINSLINDGVLLLVSFSFLTAVIYQTTRRLKINFFNVISFVILIIVASYYARVIALGYAENKIVNDASIKSVSYLSFYGSLFLLYSSLVYDKWIENFGDARGNRNNDYHNLKNDVK